VRVAVCVLQCVLQCVLSGYQCVKQKDAHTLCMCALQCVCCSLCVAAYVAVCALQCELQSVLSEDIRV